MTARDSNGRFTKKMLAKQPSVPRTSEPMGDKAFLFIELDRATGEITVDDEFSTPMETYGMLMRASQDLEDRLRPYSD